MNMPKHLFKPESKLLEQAYYLANVLSRRAMHFTSPMSRAHGLPNDHCLPASLTRLMNHTDKLRKTEGTTIALHVPNGQKTPSLLASIPEEKDSPSGKSKPGIQFLKWDLQLDDPYAATRFMDSQPCKSSNETGKAIILENYSSQNNSTSALTDYLDKHFESKVPLFIQGTDNLACHSLPGQPGCLAELPHQGLPEMMAMAITYSSFCKLIAAVELVEPEETEALCDIYEDIFTTRQA